MKADESPSDDQDGASGIVDVNEAQGSTSSVDPPNLPKDNAPVNTHKPLMAATSHPTTSLKAASVQASTNKLKEVYIGNVNSGNSCNDIAVHLGSSGIDIPSKNVRLLKQWKDSSSFCVKVHEKDFPKASDASNPIWPKGIKVRPFYEQPPRGLQSSKSHLQAHGRAFRKPHQPFRYDKRPRYTSEKASGNRFLPLQYEEYEYDDEWPELNRSYASHSGRGYY